MLAKYLKTKNKRVSGASKKAWGLPPHTPAKRSTLDRNSLRGHSPCGRGSKPSLLPCGNSVGRSIPSRVEINGLRPPLTAFSLLGNPPQAFFPLSLSRSAHLYTNSVGMCALRVFCKIQTLASRGKCDPTRDRVGVHIARLLGTHFPIPF